MRLWIDSEICPDAVGAGAVTYKTLLFPAHEKAMESKNGSECQICFNE